MTTTGTMVAGPPREALRQRLQALGFDEVRFAAVAGGQDSSLHDWLAAGHQADMHWLERTAEKRMNADLVLPGSRTVILLGVNYGDRTSGAPPNAQSPKPRWARYALNLDYHDTIKPGLAAAGRVLEEMGGVSAADYRYYVDTGPVLERGWAARSGLGFRGKNGMLISRKHGNWLFLASILTRLEIAPDEPLRKKPLPANTGEPAGLLCGKCTRCLDACPTAAFPQPGVVRGVASLIRPSRTRASSRASCAPGSARGFTDAMYAWRSAHGTVSPRPVGGCCSVRAKTSRRSAWKKYWP